MTKKKTKKKVTVNKFPCKSPDELLSVKEAAEYLKIDDRTVLRHINGGSLRAGKIGRVWRIKCSDIDAFMHREEYEVVDATDVDGNAPDNNMMR